MPAEHWYSWSGDDLIIRAHIQSRAKRDAPGTIHNNRLKIQIKAPPVAGKANSYLTGFLADEFRLPRSEIEILRGRLTNKKLIRIRKPGNLPEWFYELIQEDTSRER